MDADAGHAAAAQAAANTAQQRWRRQVAARDDATLADAEYARQRATLLTALAAMAQLVKALREAGAHDQLTVLLARDPAAHLPLDNPAAVAQLVKALREARAHDQLTALARRSPAAGRFENLLEFGDHWERFRFGREPDGSPAPSWSWEDLD